MQSPQFVVEAGELRGRRGDALLQPTQLLHPGVPSLKKQRNDAQRNEFSEKNLGSLTQLELQHSTTSGSHVELKALESWVHAASEASRGKWKMENE